MTYLSKLQMNRPMWATFNHGKLTMGALAYIDKEDSKKLKQKQRECMQPKMGKMDIDYQQLFDSLFAMASDASLLLKTVENTHLNTCNVIKSEVNNVSAFIDMFIPAFQKSKVHIVYLGDLPKAGPSPALLHQSMLKDILGSSARAKESLVYSYGRSFNGFAAKLSDDEVAKFKERDEVVSVFPNNKYALHTTRSWDFIGFPQDHLHSQHESDVIVGLLDTDRIKIEEFSFVEKSMQLRCSQHEGQVCGVT